MTTAANQSEDGLQTFFLGGGGWPLVLATATVAFFLSMMIQWLGGGMALWTLRRRSDFHWVEKARLAYPAWIVLTAGPILMAGAWEFHASSYDELLSSSMQNIFVPLMGLSALLGAVLISARIESRVKNRAISALDWLRELVVFFLCFFAHLPIFMFVAFSLPATLNLEAVGILGVGIASVTLVALGGALLVARLLRIALPASPRLLAIVNEASHRVDASPRAAFILRWKSANALAFPLTQKLAVTDTAMASFTDEELVAICAHELAHLNEPRRVALARFAGQFVWLPLFAIRPIFGSFGLAGATAALTLALLGGYLLRRMARSMEVRADSIGQSHEGDAGTYARALEKLYQINLMPAVMRQKHLAHPHLYDRLVAAQISPSYPRPAPPSGWRATIVLGAMLILASLSTAGWKLLVSTAYLGNF